jgi:hypothetical protein
MRIFLNGWYRIGIVISIGWTVYVLGLAAYEYLETDDFYSQLSTACPTLTEYSFIYWRDAKSDRKIEIYRNGEHSLNCGDAQNRATRLASRALSGDIEPIRGIDLLYLLMEVLIPIITAWALSYLTYRVFKWIVNGFRKP